MEEPLWLRYSVSLYMDRVLRPTMFLMIDYEWFVKRAVFLALTWVSLESVAGFWRLRETPADLGTSKALTMWPVAPLLTLLVTHLVLAYYAKRQFKLFSTVGKRPPFPILYAFLIGKLFMVLRHFMAFSGEQMGASMEWCMRQEAILVGTHVLCAVCILPFFPDDPCKIRDMKTMFRLIFLVDAFKTCVAFAHWLLFHPGWIAYSFERLPTMASQIYVFVLAHAVLAASHSGATLFTMSIAMSTRNAARRIANASRSMERYHALPDDAQICHEAENCDDCSVEAQLVHFSLFVVDRYWCKHLFIHQGRCDDVARNVDNEFNKLQVAYVGGCLDVEVAPQPHREVLRSESAGQCAERLRVSSSGLQDLEDGRSSVFSRLSTGRFEPVTVAVTQRFPEDGPTELRQVDLDAHGKSALGPHEEAQSPEPPDSLGMQTARANRFSSMVSFVSMTRSLLSHNANEVEVRFLPGKLGLIYDRASGLVKEVADGQAKRKGVSASWVMCSVDGAAYSEDTLSDKAHGSLPYSICFRKPEEVVLTMQPGELGLTIDCDSGLVKSVTAGEAAAAVGVKPGWYLRQVCSAQFSKVELERAKAGSSAYEAVFSRPRLQARPAARSSDIGDGDLIQDVPDTTGGHASSHCFTFEPGELGLVLELCSGLVKEVLGGQAQGAGVQVGWRMLHVDGMPYTSAMLFQKRTGQLPFAVAFCEMLEANLEFEPGPLGLVSDSRSGLVKEVYEGQAKEKGVQSGWVLESIGGAPFDSQRLRKKISGSSAYEVKFSYASNAAEEYGKPARAPSQESVQSCESFFSIPPPTPRARREFHQSPAETEERLRRESFDVVGDAWGDISASSVDQRAEDPSDGVAAQPESGQPQDRWMMASFDVVGDAWGEPAETEERLRMASFDVVGDAWGNISASSVDQRAEDQSDGVAAQPESGTDAGAQGAEAFVNCAASGSSTTARGHLDVRDAAPADHQAAEGEPDANDPPRVAHAASEESWHAELEGPPEVPRSGDCTRFSISQSGGDDEDISGISVAVAEETRPACVC